MRISDVFRIFRRRPWVVGLPLAIVSAAAGGPGRTVQIERRVVAMGTTLELAVRAPSRGAALAAADRAIAAIGAAERRLSTWDPASELSRFNSLPAGKPVELSAALARDLALAVDCSAATSGAFTPGVGRLVEAWGLRDGGRRPADAEIERLLPALGAEQLRMDGSHATRLDDRFVIEEGGFGKGVGLDDAVEQLRRTAATGAVLDLGGQVALWGDAVATIEVADPRDRRRSVLRLEVSRGSLATSGNSERGIRVGGERLGHILDPRSGRPAPDFGSLTVWADDAASADCLATGLYVLGPRGAARWAAGRVDVAVVILEVQGDRLEVHASARLEGRLRSTVEDLELHWIDDGLGTDGRRPQEGRS